MSGRDGATWGSESDESRVLREGLQVNPLSVAAMSRIRTATEAEWRLNCARPARKWIPYAATAALIVAALVMGFLIPVGGVSGGRGELSAHLVRFTSPGVVEVRLLHPATPLAEGAVLRSGSSYRMHGQALIELEDGGNIRVASESEIEVLAKNVIRLDRGEMYVDIPAGAHNSGFVARTAAGEFRHVGTQFALAVIHGETRLRVREGSVHWVAADGESTVGAGTELVFVGDTKSIERPIATTDKEWDWVANTTPDFEIENRPLEEFLVWVARESGRKLVLSDDIARKKVATIRMHGTVHGLTPMQALSAVMAATDLRYDLPDGQLRIAFVGDTRPSE